jgi:hypothetical protein
MDKQELNSSMFTALQQSTAGTSAEMPAQDAALLQPYKDSLFVKQNEPFMGLNRVIYYRMENGWYVPIEDTALLQETTNNFLMGALAARRNPALQLTHRQYGNKTRILQTNFNTVHALMAQGSTYYPMIEKNKKGDLLSVIFYNQELNCVHILSISAGPRDLLTKKNPAFDATLYTYIRLDNVSSLFGGYVEKTKKARISIK